MALYMNLRSSLFLLVAFFVIVSLLVISWVDHHFYGKGWTNSVALMNIFSTENQWKVEWNSDEEHLPSKSNISSRLFSTTLANYKTSSLQTVKAVIHKSDNSSIVYYQTHEISHRPKQAIDIHSPPITRVIPSSNSTERSQQLKSKTIAGYHQWASYLSSPAFRAKQIIDTSHFAKKEQAFKHLFKLVQKGQLDYAVTENYGLPMSWLSDRDHEVLNDAPLQDIQSVAEPTTSQIFVSPATLGTVMREGSNVSVRIDLRDACGRQVLKGGHWLRVWMTSGDRRRSAAADVQDLNNGSYFASFPVLWHGQSVVHVGLIRPREYHGIMLRLLNTMKTLFPNAALFLRNKTQQVTLCYSIPVIPGFPKVCNLTTYSYGLPWYCGMPSPDTNLTCSDWIQTKGMCCGRQFPMLAKQEQDLVKAYLSKDPLKFRLSQVFSFFAVKGDVTPKVQPCWKRRARDTWTDHAPRGFWDHKKWRPLACSLPELTASYVTECLRNTTVLLLGDSNMRMTLYKLQSITKCRLRKEGQEHDPIHCYDDARNTKLSFHAHGQPFRVLHSWSLRKNKLHPNFFLDLIPSTGKYLVLIHLYSHFGFDHTYTYGVHVREVARGVRALLSRNPSARVVVRGPHAMLNPKADLHILGDFHGERSLRMFRQEFKDLFDKVTFLNVWDMTVANENPEVHPEGLTDIVKLFLGYVCPV